MKTLLKSRKFWLAVFALVQTVVLHYVDVPKDIWMSIDGVVVVLIASIAWEDAAEKSADSGLFIEEE